jgi:hypothetical protein
MKKKKKLIAFELDAVDCRGCPSKYLTQFIAQEWDEFIQDFHITDCWFQCFRCGDSWRPLPDAKKTNITIAPENN